MPRINQFFAHREKRKAESLSGLALVGDDAKRRLLGHGVKKTGAGRADGNFQLTRNQSRNLLGRRGEIGDFSDDTLFLEESLLDGDINCGVGDCRQISKFHRLRLRSAQRRQQNDKCDGQGYVQNQLCACHFFACHISS